jgi:hypothetical protein
MLTLFIVSIVFTFILISSLESKKKNTKFIYILAISLAIISVINLCLSIFNAVNDKDITKAGSIASAIISIIVALFGVITVSMYINNKNK